MAIFDPKKAKEDNKNAGIPAGDYLLAMKSFERKRARTSGNDYLHCRFVVIAGPAKKRSFFDNIGLDLTNSGAMFRLSMLSEQCGVTAPFDLDDDAAIEANLVGRPFKARVNRKLENGYVNNGIERYLMGEAISDGDRRAMLEWAAERDEAESWDASKDDAPHAGSSDREDPFESRGGGGGPDDDIPF